MNNIDKFVELVHECNNIVFFGGAGVSTESGIPDFRSPDGLYNQKYKYPPETIISHSFYQRYPEEFYRFYKDKMLYPDAEPGITHLALAKLEKEGKLKAVVTQNIDGLHQKAGDPLHNALAESMNNTLKNGWLFNEGVNYTNI